MARTIGILMQLFFAFHWLTTSWKVKECTVSAGMSRQLQDGITAKYYTPEKKTFLQKQISRTCLEVGLEESKRIFDSDKVWGVRQTILRGGVPKVCSCFPPPCSFKCPHKMPAWDGCSTFALRTFVWLFSTVCFSNVSSNSMPLRMQSRIGCICLTFPNVRFLMCPQIACLRRGIVARAHE